MAKEAQVMCLPPLPLVGSLGLQSQLPWLEGQDYRHQLHWYLSLGFSRQEHWSGLPFPSPMHESEK